MGRKHGGKHRKGGQKEEGRGKMAVEKILVQTLRFRPLDDEGYTELCTIDLKTDEISTIPHLLSDDIGFSTMVKLGAKLYLIGGRNIFDPTLNDWDALLPPPGVEVFNVSPPLADPCHNCILLHFKDTNSLYAYFPAASRRKLLDKSVKLWYSTSVVEDGVIYFYAQARKDFFPAAFDVATKQWFTSNVDEEVARTEYDHLLNLGYGNGMLCLVGHSFDYNSRKTFIEIVKFQVKRLSTEYVLVTPVSVKSYAIDGVRCIISNIVALS